MQVLSTDTVPSHEAFAYWRDVLARHFVHLRPERVGLGAFCSTIEAQQLEGHSFSRVNAAPQRVHRARREIACSPYDLVFLNLYLRGKGSYCQAGDEIALNPGDLFIVDAMRPFELGCEGGVSQLSLKVPRWYSGNGCGMRSVRAVPAFPLRATLARFSTATSKTCGDRARPTS